MYNEKSYLALIPARGGSKRLPGKNILELAGKPLIAWTIEAALQCPYVDDVIVSTDDHEIKEVSEKYGARVPFLRPEEISSDQASSVQVVRHALDFLLSQSVVYDNIVLLQPTSPLRSGRHITEAIRLMHSREANAIISVRKSDHSPLWSNTLPENLSMETFLPEELKQTRSQDLPQYYSLNGAIYICKTDVFNRENTLYPAEQVFAYVMDREDSIDIDEKMDLLLAATIMEERIHFK